MQEEGLQPSVTLTSIVAFTHKWSWETSKNGTRKIKYTLDGGKLPSACGVATVSPPQMSTFNRRERKRELRKNSKSFSFPVSLVQSPILLSVIGLALLLSLQQCAPVVSVFVCVHKPVAGRR